MEVSVRGFRVVFEGFRSLGVLGLGNLDSRGAAMSDSEGIIMKVAELRKLSTNTAGLGFRV